MKILIPVIFFMIFLGGMLAALHWSKYKKRGVSGCCGAHDTCDHFDENGKPVKDKVCNKE